jgi:hypothetical protein
MAAALTAFTPCYQQNDDVVMAMIASGKGIALEPDSHLVFVNALLGGALRQAYRWAPTLPWYGLLLVAFQAVANVALLHALLVRAGSSQRPRVWGSVVLAYCLYFVTVAGAFVGRLQFTTAACLAAQVGLVLWMTSLRPAGEADPADRGGTRATVAAALILLGSLLRFQALILSLAVCLPLALVSLSHAGRRPALRALGVLAAVLFVAVGLRTVDQRWYGRDPAWAAFRELNVWRARIIDYGAGADDPGAAARQQSLGWTANDALLLRRWFYPDPNVFPPEKMRRLVEAAPLARRDAARAWNRILEALHLPALVPMALVVPLLLVSIGSWRARLLVLGLCLAPGVAAAVLLALFLHAPEHVVLSALAFAPMALLAAGKGGEGGRRRWWWAALALAAVGGLVAIAQRRCVSEEAVEANRELRLSLAQLAPRPEQLYVEWAGAFPYESVLPFEDGSYLANLRLYSLGWLQRSPIADGMLRAFRIEDLFRSLYDRPGTFLLMDDQSWSNLLERYGRERYGVSLWFPVRVRTPAFAVFQAERAGAPVASRPEVVVRAVARR